MAGSLCRNFVHQLLHVNWYFNCVGVCLSSPNRCPDSSALASVSILFHTQRSPLHCTCGKDRLRLTQFQRNANETPTLNFVKLKETVFSIKFAQLTFVTSVTYLPILVRLSQEVVHKGDAIAWELTVTLLFVNSAVNVIPHIYGRSKL